MYVTPFIIMFVHFIVNKRINLFDFLFLFNFNFENVMDWFCVSPFTSEYNFLPQGIKMEQFFARSFRSSEKIPKTVSFGVNSKTSKSKADESQILNEVQNLFATG